MGDLQDFVTQDIKDNGRPGYPSQFCDPVAMEILELVNTKTILIIGEQRYLIASMAIMANGLRPSGIETPHRSCFKYIYLCQHGAEIIIELAELPLKGSAPVSEVKQGAFFQHLKGRHFR